MVDIVKAKDGSITEISDLMTVREMHGQKYVIFPIEFFTIGKLPWKNPEKVRTRLKLTSKKPRVVIEEPDPTYTEDTKTMGQTLNEAYMKKTVPGVS